MWLTSMTQHSVYFSILHIWVSQCVCVCEWVLTSACPAGRRLWRFQEVIGWVGVHFMLEGGFDEYMCVCVCVCVHVCVCFQPGGGFPIISEAAFSVLQKKKKRAVWKFTPTNIVFRHIFSTNSLPTEEDRRNYYKEVAVGLSRKSVICETSSTSLFPLHRPKIA